MVGGNNNASKEGETHEKEQDEQETKLNLESLGNDSNNKTRLRAGSLRKPIKETPTTRGEGEELEGSEFLSARTNQTDIFTERDLQKTVKTPEINRRDSIKVTEGPGQRSTNKRKSLIPGGEEIVQQLGELLAQIGMTVGDEVEAGKGSSSPTLHRSSNMQNKGRGGRGS